MNLLNLLMNSMTTDSSVNSLTQKTGASSDQMSQLIQLALPLLMKAMTKNASSPAGAQSLLGALNQHTNTNTMAQQMAAADVVDGGKIIGHILGDSSGDVMGQLAAQTGMNQDQVFQALGTMAPAMMSGLSAATGSAAQRNAAPDPMELMRMFGGQMPAQNQQPVGGGAAGMLGALLGAAGGGSQNQGSFDGSELLGVLTALMK
ncbi:MAG: DUF937 domain-containing protein [Oscillospiraceae bacterium]|nr:DUF937 domain-containing protein [Oscillospiraceae bacterium]